MLLLYKARRLKKCSWLVTLVDVVCAQQLLTQQLEDMRVEDGHSDEEGQLRGAPEQTNLKLALIQIQQQKQLNQPQCAEFACTASWCQP